jgi:hypothetical protein
MTKATPPGAIDEQLVQEAAARRSRLAEHFEAIARLDRILDRIYETNSDRLHLTGPARTVLAGCYGKALKTLDAIRIPCEAGDGEDAMILARSLVNLTINMGYVGRASDPDEPARDFIAAGWIAPTATS